MLKDKERERLAEQGDKGKAIITAGGRGGLDQSACGSQRPGGGHS